MLASVTRRLAMTPSRGALAFSAGRARYSSHSSMHENDPDKLHDIKTVSLKQQKEGKGEWHESLASDAEAYIKAERDEIKSSSEEIKKLQKETEQLLNKSR